MIINLEGSTSAKISAELIRVRRSAGSPTQGMVLTLIIVCDESEFPGALEASMAAGREHPSRILLARLRIKQQSQRVVSSLFYLDVLTRYFYPYCFLQASNYHDL